MGGGVIFYYNFIISFLQKQPAPEKGKCFYKNFLGSVNASVIVTCQYRQIYEKTP